MKKFIANHKGVICLIGVTTLVFVTASLTAKLTTNQIIAALNAKEARVVITKDFFEYVQQNGIGL